MRRVAHISDLHFGTEDEAIANGLVADLAFQGASLIAVSGDLTQRARSRQFRAARQFLDRLTGPRIVVPGNHDVPLFDVLRRFLAPFRRYRRFIARELNQTFEDDEILLLGINTARSLTWKSGRISYEQIEWLRERLSNAPRQKFKIVMTHHPFIPPAGDEVSGIDLLGRARQALPVLDLFGVDLLLAGHLHHGYSGDVRTFYPATSRSIIVAQAGTAISRRIRHEPNGYNLLRLDKDIIDIEVRAWKEDRFVSAGQVCYELQGKEWKLLRGQ